jgi:hypothetical protein
MNPRPSITPAPRSSFRLFATEPADPTTSVCRKIESPDASGDDVEPARPDRVVVSMQGARPPGKSHLSGLGVAFLTRLRAPARSAQVAAVERPGMVAAQRRVALDDDEQRGEPQRFRLNAMRLLARPRRWDQVDSHRPPGAELAHRAPPLLVQCCRRDTVLALFARWLTWAPGSAARRGVGIGCVVHPQPTSRAFDEGADQAFGFMAAETPALGSGRASPRSRCASLIGVDVFTTEPLPASRSPLRCADRRSSRWCRSRCREPQDAPATRT